MTTFDANWNNFKKALPCNTCRFSGLCKHKETIAPVDIPDFLHVEMKCEYQQSLLKGDN